MTEQPRLTPEAIAALEAAGKPSEPTTRPLADRIVLRAFVVGQDAQEKCGGTGIDIPAGLSLDQIRHYVTGHAAGELSRYLVHECLTALGRVQHRANP